MWKAIQVNINCEGRTCGQCAYVFKAPPFKDQWWCLIYGTALWQETTKTGRQRLYRAEDCIKAEMT